MSHGIYYHESCDRLEVRVQVESDSYTDMCITRGWVIEYLPKRGGCPISCVSE